MPNEFTSLSLRKLPFRPQNTSCLCKTPSKRNSTPAGNARSFKRELGKTIMEDWLASGQEIDGVAANNDEMALGALQAIKAARKIDKIPVGGTDGTHDALESMNKGELNNTVFQDPVAQGEEAVNAAYLLVKKEPNPKIVDDNVWIPYQKITKENYKSFMK